MITVDGIDCQCRGVTPDDSAGIESSWQLTQTMGGWFDDKEGYEALMTQSSSR